MKSRFAIPGHAARSCVRQKRFSTTARSRTMATMAISGQEMELQARSAERESTLSARRAKSVAERNRELFEQQQSRRRGPTPEMFFAKYIDNTRLVTEDDPDR